MSDTTTEARTRPRPYAPSWIDRFSDWVERLPLPEWVFYVALGLALILIQVLFLWWDGGLQSSALLPVVVLNALTIPYLLALIHLLDRRAMAALHDMRPTLNITEPELASFQYRLSTMPSRPAFVAGAAMVVFLLLTERLGAVPVRYAALSELPVFAIVFQWIDKSIPFVFGPFIYHTIAQLRVVNAIYSNHTRINLFDLKPVYAFSRLTATTAAGLAILLYGWTPINPEFLTDPLNLGVMAGFTVLALVVFVWPLLGAHRLMQAEKERQLHDIDGQFEAVFAMLNQRISERDFSTIEPLNGTIASLEIQRAKIKAIPTWPWEPDTVRNLVTAIVLPLVLRILQSLVEPALTR